MCARQATHKVGHGARGLLRLRRSSAAHTTRLEERHCCQMPMYWTPLEVATRLAEAASLPHGQVPADTWFTWVDPKPARILQLRAVGRRWKLICRETGLGRAAAHEHWTAALCVIACRLNGWALPSRFGKRRLIAWMQVQVADHSSVELKTNLQTSLGATELSGRRIS